MRDEYAIYGITPILNIAASPEFNPIETVFSKVKAHFRRARLNALANDVPWDMDEEVLHAFHVVTPELVQACFKRSYYLLK